MLDVIGMRANFLFFWGSVSFLLSKEKKMQKQKNIYETDICTLRVLSLNMSLKMGLANFISVTIYDGNKYNVKFSKPREVEVLTVCSHSKINLKKRCSSLKIPFVKA